MHTFKLKILTPDEKLFEGEVVSFTIPTQAGEITILKNHTPLISVISIGELKVHLLENESKKYVIQGGVLDVKKEGAVVLADQLIDTDNIENLEKELARTKEVMQSQESDIDFALEESIIERGLFLEKLKK